MKLKQLSFLCVLHPKPNCAENRVTEVLRNDSHQEACINQKGLFGMLIKNPPERFPWPQSAFDWQSVTNGALAVAMGFVGFVILAWILTRYLPRLEFLSGLILVPAVPRKGKEIPVSMTGPVVNQGVAVKVGDIGKVLSTLRPTGKAKFGEHIVDVVAEAEFLQPGKEVEIIEIHGNRVVVKACDS